MISVVVPVYNCEEFLRRCVESILNQSKKNIEIVLVDDGSTDDSGAICDEYSEKHSNIKTIHKMNKGVISARVDGVRAASSEWIGFVDSDDYLESEMYERLSMIANEYDCDMISSGIIRNWEADGVEEVCFDHYREGLYRNLDSEIYPTMLYDFGVNDFGMYCNLVTKLFKRELLLSNYNYIDQSITYGEDAAALYTYCLRCRSIYIHKSAYYHYCIREDSMCGQSSPELAVNTYRLFNTLKIAFDSQACKHVLRRQLKRYIMDIEVNYMEKNFDINPGVFNIWEFGFPERVLDKKYVIYGAGGCGQAIFHWIRRENKDANLVLWVDKNPRIAEVQADHCIYSVTALSDYEFDFVIIAVKNKRLADSICIELINDYCIDKEKIFWCACKEDSFFSKALY